MTDSYELPPLPGPYAQLPSTSREDEWTMLLRQVDCFAADQMRAYGEACARVERERCAQIADDALGCEADQIAAAIRGEPT